MFVLFTDKKPKGLKTKSAAVVHRIANVSKTKNNSSINGSALEFALVYKKTSGKLGVRKFKIIRKKDIDRFSNPEIAP
jgi:ribosomal protein S11